MEFTAEDEFRLLELKKQMASAPQKAKEEKAEGNPSEAEEATQEDHTHTISKDQGNIFCPGCNKSLINPKAPEKLEIADALSCPTCSKNIFESLTSKFGFYEKKGDDYIIHTKKKDSARPLL